jgi:hypothetical protein
LALTEEKTPEEKECQKQKDDADDQEIILTFDHKETASGRQRWFGASS